MLELSNGFYRQSIGGCLADAIGSHGLNRDFVALYTEKLREPLLRLKAAYKSGALPLLRVPEDTDDLAAARAALDRLSEGARTIVFYGTGGSGLGGKMLAQYSGWYVPGQNEPGANGRPQVRFYDNLDADTLARTLAAFDLPTTRFVMITKSGGTPETLMQSIATLQAVREAGLADRIPAMFLGLTEPYRDGGKNGMRDLCQHFGIPTLEHHTGVGGRYSVLTNVGLLPAMALGLNAAAIRAGARQMVADMLSTDDAAGFAPAVGAALAVAYDKEKHIRNLVLMPYADRLGQFGAWYAQLWAESLGKSLNGSTPIAALGPVDQHSQLQLYLDGPRDHLVTLMRLDERGSGPRLDAELARIARAEPLAGRTTGDLVYAEQSAIRDALVKSGRPVRTIDLPKLDEATMGALIMHFMMETILAADLYAIDAFDQPAVELGKIITREYLSKMG